MNNPNRKADIAFWIIAAAYCAYALGYIYKTSGVVDGERYFFLFDDAMVSMRYARNLAEGFGLVWNPAGERVEGFTNLLWTLYMSFAHLLPVPPSKICLLIQLTSLGFLIGALWFVRLLVRELCQKDSVAAELSAVALTASYLPLNTWALQGMEVGVLAFIIAWVSCRCVRALQTQTFSRWPYLVLGIGTLVRLDMAVPLLATGLFMARTDKANRRRHVFWLLAALVVFLGVQTLFRRLYYGDWLPNTYYLKMTGYPLADRVMRGAFEFKNFVAQMNWALFLLPAILLVVRPSRGLQFVLWLIASQCAYSVYVGGDAWEWYGGANRFIAIVTPLYFAAFALALSQALFAVSPQSVPKRTRLIANSCLAATVFFCSFNFNATRGPASWREWALVERPIHARENARSARLAIAARRIFRDHAKIAVVWAGGFPYWSNLHCIDLLGKSDRRIAHMDSVKYSGLHVAYRDYCPGHMKWDYDYSIKDLEPDAIIALWQNPEGAHPHLLGKYTRVNILGTAEDSPKDWPFLRLDSEQIKWDKVPGSESDTPLAE